jgi:predicted regulator of Ras-like GTPase activity (Roadblock/LC7/MglB family)
MEANTMAASDKLKELAGLEGFSGAAVYTPTGEALVTMAGDHHLKEVGVLANHVLLNAQKASIEMGTGRGHQVHVEAEKAHIFVRCLNEGTDPLKSQPGKAHIHLVLVLKSDAAIGLAKLRVASVIEKLAEDFRV